jgi:predicted  nucleic acid-binding Zn-ribbon protein
LKEAIDDLGTIEREVGLKNDQIGNLKMRAEQKALDRVKEQRIFRGVMKVVGGALKLVPVGQPYLGLGADVVSGIGDLDLTNPANLPTQISSTFGKVGALANTFMEENEDLIVNDMAGPPRPDGTPALAEQLRRAEAAVKTYDDGAAQMQRKRLENWEKAHSSELAALETDASELADLDRTISSLELEAQEKERLGELIKKKYGANLGGDIAETLLERRVLLVDAVQASKSQIERARTDSEKEALRKRSRKLDQLNKTAAGLSEELAQGKYKQAQDDKKLEAKKQRYKDTVGRLKKVGDGVSTIGVGVAALMSAPTTADQDVQNLSQMLLQSEYRADYERLLQEAGELASKQARTMAKLNEAQQRISGAVAEIATNLDELEALSHQRQSLSPVLDIRVKRYLKGMDARARDALRWAIYALIQAYRYENLEDVGKDLYNIEKLVTQIRKLKASSEPAAVSGGVAGEAQLPWPDFKAINDTIFRNELVQMAIDILKKRQKFDMDRENSTPIELSDEQLATLQKTASVTFNLLRDFDIGLSFEATRARIVDVDLTGLTIALKPSASTTSIRAVFVHSGQSIVRGHDHKYYYFRQAHEDNPISWGFRYRTDDRTIQKDANNDEEDLTLLKQFLGDDSSAATHLVKLKQYYPSLFSDINLSLKLKNSSDIERISSLKFTVKYRIAKD